MKKLFLLIGLLFTINAWAQDTTRVLFVGNSYTFVNDLPSIIKSISETKGHIIESEEFLAGGATLSAQWNNDALKQRIAQGGFDFMVLQGQSQECAFPQEQFLSQVRPYAKSLDSLFKAYNPNGKVVFYMTWGYRYGDAVNCEFYPPFCSYWSMTQELYNNYRQMALDFGSIVAPVGAAWRYSMIEDTNIVLHASDNSHPNQNGSYLAACVFYSTLFVDSCNTSFYGDLAQDSALRMQRIANKVVLDSLSWWNIIPSSLPTLPAKDNLFNINYNQQTQILTINASNYPSWEDIFATIYNIQGVVVRKDQIHCINGEIHATIHLKFLPKGLYILNIGKEKFKLIK